METLLAAPPVIVAAVRAVFHVMLDPEGIRTRRSFAVVMVAVAASVIVTAAIAVGAWPTTKTWFAADASVGATIWIVFASTPVVPLPGPKIASSRLSVAEGAAKLVYCSPETLIWSPPVKSVVTLRTSVLPPSS